MNTFGERIVEIRKKRKMTQQDLGTAVGVDKRVISKYETNQTVPSVIMAYTIAQALNVSLDYLIGSETALMIEDKEIINLLKSYDKLSEEIKLTLKNTIKALMVYSQVKEAV